MRPRHTFSGGRRAVCAATALLVALFAWCSEAKTFIHGRAFVGDRAHPIVKGLIGWTVYYPDGTRPHTGSGFRSTNKDGLYAMEVLALSPGSRLVFKHRGCDVITKDIPQGQDLSNIELDLAFRAWGLRPKVVLRTLDGVPLKYLNVSLYQSDVRTLIRSTQTDSSGSFPVEGLPAGTYRLEFDHPHSLRSGRPCRTEHTRLTIKPNDVSRTTPIEIAVDFGNVITIVAHDEHSRSMADFGVLIAGFPQPGERSSRAKWLTTRRGWRNVSPAPWWSQRGTGEIFLTETPKDGTATIIALSPGPPTRFGLIEQLDWEGVTGERRVTLILRRSSPARVRIKDEKGVPIDDVRVTYSAMPWFERDYSPEELLERKGGVTRPQILDRGPAVGEYLLHSCYFDGWLGLLSVPSPEDVWLDIYSPDGGVVITEPFCVPDGSVIVLRKNGILSGEVTAAAGTDSKKLAFLGICEIKVTLANGRVKREHLKADGSYLICVGDQRPALLEFSCLGFEKKSIANPAVGKREVIELQAIEK